MTRTTLNKLIAFLPLNRSLQVNGRYIKAYSNTVKLVKLEEVIYVLQFTKDMLPYHNYYVVLSSFMTSHVHTASNVSYHRVCNKRNTTGDNAYVHSFSVLARMLIYIEH